MREEGVILRREPPFLFARLKPLGQQPGLKLGAGGKELDFIMIVCWGGGFLFVVVWVSPPPPSSMLQPSQGWETLTWISTDFPLRSVEEGGAEAGRAQPGGGSGSALGGSGSGDLSVGHWLGRKEAICPGLARH